MDSEFEQLKAVVYDLAKELRHRQVNQVTINAPLQRPQARLSGGNGVPGAGGGGGGIQLDLQDIIASLTTNANGAVVAAAILQALEHDTARRSGTRWTATSTIKNYAGYLGRYESIHEGALVLDGVEHQAWGDDQTEATVDSVSPFWKDTGVILYEGQTLRCEASGAVEWDPEPYYALPEGAYRPDFPNTHDLEPDNVVDYGDFPALDFAASNTKPFSLALLIRPYQQGAPASPVSDALRPNRDTVFTAAEITAAGGGTGTGPWKVWAIFNDYR